MIFGLLIWLFFLISRILQLLFIKLNDLLEMPSSGKMFSVHVFSNFVAFSSYYQNQFSQIVSLD